jgi:preprotein translocase subunit SecE
MKKPHKKKKKKGIRKKPQSESRPKIISKSDFGSIGEEKEKKKKTVQTIAKKEPEKRRDEKGPIIRYVNIASQFLKESKMELKKVKWPTRKELLASTAMVIFLVLAVALFLGLIDFGLIKIIKNIVGGAPG